MVSLILTVVMYLGLIFITLQHNIIAIKTNISGLLKDQITEVIYRSNNLAVTAEQMIRPYDQDACNPL